MSESRLLHRDRISSYVLRLEEELKGATAELANNHLDASIDAKVSVCLGQAISDCPDVDFDDYQNPDSVSNILSPFDPSNGNQLTSFLEFLDDYHWSMDAASSEKGLERENVIASENNDDGSKNTVGKRKRPVLLDMGCGDGRVAVAAAHFDLCSSAIGLDVSPLCVSASRVLAFKQKVFNKCHFFETDLTADPQLLLGNPHLLSEKILESDVIFLYVYPTLLEKLIPLLAILSGESSASADSFLDVSMQKKRRIVTLVYHLPDTVGINPKMITEELCSYDGVKSPLGDKSRELKLDPFLPEPVDADKIDKDFARTSIKHTLPPKN